MGFSIIRLGVFLWFLVSTISVAAIQSAVIFVLEIAGIKLRHAAPPVQRSNSIWTWNSIEAEHERSSGPWDLFRSLRDEIRDSLSVVLVDPVAERFSSEEDAICAVCLCEYQKEDHVWLLPFCPHMFHKRCLDRWLDNNQTSCPTCRSSLLTGELAKKSKRIEEELMRESALWFSFYHGPASMSGPWWYQTRSHGGDVESMI